MVSSIDADARGTEISTRERCFRAMHAILTELFQAMRLKRFQQTGEEALYKNDLIEVKEMKGLMKVGILQWKFRSVWRIIKARTTFHQSVENLKT